MPSPRLKFALGQRTPDRTKKIGGITRVGEVKRSSLERKAHRFNQTIPKHF
ncbi:hypothetical protein BSU04_00530 [Caballeronia sordidicola]|uniref:Uncharacterized protein n=1 Tax=Caballeronia sordidicola TaxID=196367 RepID=A0A226XAR8_CABSO|nr:hypothetical protein BSU04_00530 [Caballeronia sordidicola]